MGKRKLICIVAVGVVALSIAFGIFLGSTVKLDKGTYPRSVESLDLSGQALHRFDSLEHFHNLQHLDLRGTGLTEEQYYTLRSWHPSCQIDWDIPFQNNFLDSTTSSVTVLNLTRDDVVTLDLLPELTTVQAPGCEDLENLMLLQARRPDLTVNYTVPISGKDIPSDAESFTLRQPSLSDLMDNLRYLPHMKQITLEGKIKDLDRLLLLRQEYPAIDFRYDVDMAGHTFPNDIEEVDISGTFVTSLTDLEELLPHFTNLKKLVMCDCGITSEEMAALRDRHPEIKVVWSINIGTKGTLRTDATTFMPWKLDCVVYDEDLTELKYCTDLEVLDMGHNGIKDCEFLRYMPKMRYLILADTSITSLEPIRGLENVIYLEVFLTSIRDYSPILDLPNLKDLNVCFTVADIEPLLQMPYLERLWIAGDHLSRVEQLRLFANLPNTQIAFPASSTGDHWRDNDRYREMRDLLDMAYYS